MGICNQGCKKGWSGLMCGSGINKKHACYLILCNTKTNIFVYTILSKKIGKNIPYDLDIFSNRQPYRDNKPIVIGIVLAVVIVLIGSVINFIYWRKKTGTPNNSYFFKDIC